MTLRDKAAAWWSAWRWVALLAALLAGSVTLNLRQWRDRAVSAAVDASDARAQAYAEANATTAGIARRAQQDNRALLAALAAIAERGRTTRVVYRQAAAAQPLGAGCAPGRARMDAVNAGADP